MSVEEPVITVSIGSVVDEEVMEMHALPERDRVTVHPLTFSELGASEIAK
jgi:hypothetical protein